MLMPSIFRDNLFDDWFDFPDFRDLDRTERKLYGRHADRLMKTDVHEHEDHYEVDIDLPGFAKERRMYMSMKTTMKWISICLVLRKTSLQLN